MMLAFHILVLAALFSTFLRRNNLCHSRLLIVDFTLFTAVAGGIQACTEDGTVPQISRQRKLSATAALTLQL